MYSLIKISKLVKKCDSKRTRFLFCCNKFWNFYVHYWIYLCIYVKILKNISQWVFLSNASHVSIRSLTSCRPKQDLPVQDPYILQQIKIILMVREKVTYENNGVKNECWINRDWCDVNTSALLLWLYRSLNRSGYVGRRGHGDTRRQLRLRRDRTTSSGTHGHRRRAIHWAVIAVGSILNRRAHKSIIHLRKAVRSAKRGVCGCGGGRRGVVGWRRGGSVLNGVLRHQWFLCWLKHESVRVLLEKALWIHGWKKCKREAIC